MDNQSVQPLQFSNFDNYTIEQANGDWQKQLSPRKNRSQSQENFVNLPISTLGQNKFQSSQKLVSYVKSIQSNPSHQSAILQSESDCGMPISKEKSYIEALPEKLENIVEEDFQFQDSKSFSQSSKSSDKSLIKQEENILDEDFAEIDSISNSSNNKDDNLNEHQDLIDRLDIGVARFIQVSSDSPTQSKQSFTFKWCNDQFNDLFECQSNCLNLQLKIFSEYSINNQVQSQLWSIMDLLKEAKRRTLETHSEVSFQKLFELNHGSIIDPQEGTHAKKRRSPANKCNYSSVELQNITENHSTLNVILIKVCSINIDSEIHYLVYVTDVSAVQTFGLHRIQKLFQSILTNALSHERMTPLNSMINLTELIIQKCDKFLDTNDISNLQNDSFVSQQQINQSHEDSHQDGSDSHFDKFCLYVKSKCQTVWSAAKLMHMMTQSQINHYQIDCNRIKFNLVELKTNEFTDLILDFLEPFQVAIEQKSLKVNIKSFSVSSNELAHVEQSICTDWEIYKSVLFHIMQNAIKFSFDRNQIQIKIQYKEVTQEMESVKGMLITTIVNQGKIFDLERLKRKSFKTFAFSKMGLNQLQQERSGIGIGLSTADAMVQALGGDLQISCQPHLMQHLTEVKFTIMTTDMQYMSSKFAKDCLIIKNQKSSIFSNYQKKENELGSQDSEESKGDSPIRSLSARDKFISCVKQQSLIQRIGHRKAQKSSFCLKTPVIDSRLEFKNKRIMSHHLHSIQIQRSQSIVQMQPISQVSQSLGFIGRQMISKNQEQSQQQQISEIPQQIQICEQQQQQQQMESLSSSEESAGEELSDGDANQNIPKFQKQASASNVLENKGSLKLDSDSQKQLFIEFKNQSLSKIQLSRRVPKTCASQKKILQINQFEIKKQISVSLSNSLVKNNLPVCSSLCQETVLLIDDNDYNLIPLHEMLKFNFNIQSTCFNNGKDAIACYQRRLHQKCCRSMYWLVLTDIQMPTMDGYEVAKLINLMQKMWFPKLKESLTFGIAKMKLKCPVVAVTAFHSDEVVENASKVGIQHVLHKPVSVLTLGAMLNKFYKQKEDSP